MDQSETERKIKSAQVPFLAEWGMGVGDYYCWADLATLRVCAVPCWRMAQETRPNRQPMRVELGRATEVGVYGREQICGQQE